MNCRFYRIGIAWLLVVCGSTGTRRRRAGRCVSAVRPSDDPPAVSRSARLRHAARVGTADRSTLGLVDVTKSALWCGSLGERDSTAGMQAAILGARSSDGLLLSAGHLSGFRHAGMRPAVVPPGERPRLRRESLPQPAGRFASRPAASDDRPRSAFARGSTIRRDRRSSFTSGRAGILNPTTGDRVTDGLPPEVEQPNIGMNQMLVNLDVVIGEGNPGAIAVRHQAAEGSAIEDCTIDATHGLTGIQGGIGSGGGSAGVTVIGGRIGLDFTGYLSGTQPTPTITGFTLQGQTEAAIRSSSRQTLVAAGLKIVADRCAGPLIQISSGLVPPWTGPGNHASAREQRRTDLVDSRDRVRRATRCEQPQRVAVASDRGVYLHNVYVRGATHAVVDPAQHLGLAGNPEGWLRVRQYAHGCRPLADQGVEYRYPVYVDGQRVPRVSETETDARPPSRPAVATPLVAAVPELRVARRGECPLGALRCPRRWPSRRHRGDPARDRRERDRLPAQRLLSLDSHPGAAATNEADRSLGPASVVLGRVRR
jgi:hypothetical protein